MDCIEIVRGINSISSIIILIFIGILALFKNSILLYISNALNIELEKEKSDLNGKVLTKLEDHKKSIQKELDVYKHTLDSILEDQKSEYNLLNTRYGLLKKEKLVCYKEIYGQLYKTIKYFKDYLNHKCFVKIGEGYDDHLVSWIKESQMHPINQLKLIEAIKNRDSNAQNLFEHEERMILYGAVSKEADALTDYFNMNRILINDSIAQDIEKIIEDINFILLYVNASRLDNNPSLANVAFIQQFGFEYPKDKEKIIGMIDDQLLEVQKSIIDLLEME